MEELELLIAFVLFYGALEMFYLKVAASAYQRNFSVVQSTKRAADVHLGWAALAYAALFVSVYTFVVRPIFRASSRGALPRPASIATNATMLAIAIYGVYNFTNLATLKGYAPMIAAMDVAWGVFAINAVAAASYALKRWVLARP
jgi:uncharacterized membrane protein